MAQQTQIAKTGRITLEGRTFEVEQSIHHLGKTYAECEKDCPKGWEISNYWLLQGIRNSPQRDEFGLLDTCEYVQNPDNISKKHNFLAWFYADSQWAFLFCNRDPENTFPELAVRYVREISEAKSSNPLREKHADGNRADSRD